MADRAPHSDRFGQRRHPIGAAIRGFAVGVAGLGLLGPAVAVAQRGPAANGPQSAAQQLGRTPLTAGRFTVVRLNDDLLLVDGQTGCVWIRSESNRADNGGLPWKHEFPNGGRQQCYDVLIRLQQENK